MLGGNKESLLNGCLEAVEQSPALPPSPSPHKQFPCCCGGPLLQHILASPPLLLCGLDFKFIFLARSLATSSPLGRSPCLFKVQTALVNKRMAPSSPLPPNTHMIAHSAPSRERRRRLNRRLLEPLRQCLLIKVLISSKSEEPVGPSGISPAADGLPKS